MARRRAWLAGEDGRTGCTKEETPIRRTASPYIVNGCVYWPRQDGRHPGLGEVGNDRTAGGWPVLVLRRKPQERIAIGPDVEVTVVEIEPGGVTLGIEAPRDVAITRREPRKGAGNRPARVRGRRRIVI
jgi:carbon storage regulator CsrA